MAVGGAWATALVAHLNRYDVPTLDPTRPAGSWRPDRNQHPRQTTSSPSRSPPLGAASGASRGGLPTSMSPVAIVLVPRSEARLILEAAGPDAHCSDLSVSIATRRGPVILVDDGGS